MARLPSVDIPSPDALRPVEFSGQKKIVTYDTSNVGAGFRSFGKAAQKVGQQIEQEATSLESETAGVNLSVAESQILDDEKNNPDFQSMETNAISKFDAAIEKEKQGIWSPRAKANFELKAKAQRERLLSNVRDNAKVKEINHDRVTVNETLNNLKELAAKDPSKAPEISVKMSAVIEAARKKGTYNEVYAEIIAQAWRQDTTAYIISKMNPYDAEMALNGEPGKAIPLEERDRLLEDVKRKARTEYAVGWVDANYTGDVSAARKKLSEIKDANARLAAEQRLSQVINIQQSDKSDRQERSERAYIIYREQGGELSAYDWGQKNPAHLRNMSNSFLESHDAVDESARKTVSVTPYDVTTEMMAIQEEAAKTGDYKPLWAAARRNFNKMSKADQKRYAEFEKDKTIPQEEEKKLANFRLIEAKTTGMPPEDKEQLLSAVYDFDKEKLNEKGRMPTQEETEDFLATALTRVDKSYLPNSYGKKGSYVVSVAGGSYAAVQDFKELQKKAAAKNETISDDDIEAFIEQMGIARQDAYNQHWQKMKDAGQDPDKYQALFQRSFNQKWNTLRGPVADAVLSK